MKVAAIMLLLLGSPADADSQYDEAATNLGRALVIQTGFDRDMDAFVKKHVPEKYVAFAEQWGTVGKVLTERKVEFKWTW